MLDVSQGAVGEVKAIDQMFTPEHIIGATDLVTDCKAGQVMHWKDTDNAAAHSKLLTLFANLGKRKSWKSPLEGTVDPMGSRTKVLDLQGPDPTKLHKVEAPFVDKPHCE